MTQDVLAVIMEKTLSMDNVNDVNNYNTNYDF